MAAGRVLIETYGCQMNKAESEAILADLREDGWSLTESPDEADLVVINTCSVRETAEERVRGRLGWFRSRKRGRPFTLVLTGCMAERLKGRALKEFPEIDAVVGNFDKHALREVVRRVSDGSSAPGSSGEASEAGRSEYRFSALHSAGGPRAFVPVMHGCDNFCSYCIVPYVRGREVSRNPDAVLAELRTLASRGTADVTLLGQNVNSYRCEGPQGTIRFARLLRMAAREARSIRWIRFLTSHPKDFSREIVEVMAGEPKVCRHVHLPVQSGSDRILRLMNRGYTASQYLALVQEIRDRLPGVALTTDILVGFPTETEQDASITLALMREVGFDEAFTYRYNPRPGTAACKLGSEVPEVEKLARLERVIALQRSISRQRARQRLGLETEVLVEAVSRRSSREVLARTEWDAMVVLPGDAHLVGRFVRVELFDLAGATFRAKVL